jgi:lipopolysaccharide transport system permease protein
MSVDVGQQRTIDTAPAPAAPGGKELPETVIDARSGWSWADLWEIWSRRELIYFLMRRDIKVRYRQTSLGLAWALLQPAIMTVVFTVFVGPLSGAAGGLRVPYPLYVYVGFLAWNFFASSVISAGNSVVLAENLITKVYFPRIIVPLSTVGTNLVDLAVGSIGIPLLLLYYRLNPPQAEMSVAPGWGLLLIPLWVVLVALAALGTGTLIAALNVRYRDFRYLVPFIVQVWMFSTPSIFLRPAKVEASIFGSQITYELLRSLLMELNPMNSVIALFRGLVLGDEVLPWPSVGVAALVILCVLGVGCWYFRRVENTFADII